MKPIFLRGRLTGMGFLASLLPLAFFGVFYFYPLGAILAKSVGPQMWATWIAADTWQVVAFTFGQAALSTLLTVVVGLPGAYLLARYKFRGQGWLRALTAVPFVMPTLVVAAGFNALLGPRGWINLGLAALGAGPIRLTGTLAAILLAHVFYNTTIILRLVGDYWSHLDPRLTQAARVLGAHPARAFLTVTLPLLAPALLTAGLLVFIFNFTSFGVILVLGGPNFATLEVEIYRRLFAVPDLPGAAALTLMQLACTFALAGLYTQLAARQPAFTNLRSSEFVRRALTTRRQKLMALLILAPLLGLLVAPLAALTARSLTRFEADRGQRPPAQPALTLDYYRALFENERGQAFFVTPIEALGNSARYAGLTVVLSLALGLPTAWAFSQPRRNRLSRLIEAALLLPLGTSAVTLGLGFLIAFSRPPLNLRASPWLIPLAHTLIAFPFVTRALLPIWRSLRPSWRAAAATLGASPAETWLRIDLPLIGRAILVAAAFAFAVSLGEFGATALLTRPELPTAAATLYKFIGQPGALNYGRALALSVLLMLATAGSILVIERARLKGIAEF